MKGIRDISNGEEICYLIRDFSNNIREEKLYYACGLTKNGMKFSDDFQEKKVWKRSVVELWAKEYNCKIVSLGIKTE